MARTWFDLSHPLSEATPPFPGDPPVTVTVLDRTDQTGPEPREHLNCSRLEICVHCGTHLDAPFHFFADGVTIDQLPLETCVGPACLIDLTSSAASEPDGIIDAAKLAEHAEGVSSSRVLLQTGWFERWGQDDYFTRHPVLTRDAARWLVDAGVQLIGVDFPSVDRPPHAAHLELLGSGVVIVENLTRLNQLPRSGFEFAALPLALVGRDGSPVRAVAWKESEA